MMRVALVPEDTLVADASGIYLSIHEATREALEGDWRLPPTITGLISDAYGVDFRSAGWFLTHYLVAHVWAVEGHHRLLLVGQEDETLLLLRKDELTFLSDWRTTVAEMRELMLTSFLAREAQGSARIFITTIDRLRRMEMAYDDDDIERLLMINKELCHRSLLSREDLTTCRQ